jgi:hypothetical protein
MTFEQFMVLSPPLRERRSQLLLEADALAQRIERQFPDAALHDGALIEPFHHGTRRQWRHPWFRNDRNHV